MASFTLAASAAPAHVVAPGNRAQRKAKSVKMARGGRQHVSAGAKFTCMAADGPKRIVIAGAPASGKGTQCELIVEKYGLTHISAGDLLRAAVAEGTDAGKKAKEYMDRGDLVPNEVVVDMVKDRLSQEDAQTKGWLLDGYPRSADQADAIAAEGINPDVFLLLNVPDEILIERVVGRRLDPETGTIYHMTFFPPPEDIVDRLTQRSDDTEEKAKNRLSVHHSNVDAVVGKYADIMKEIDGNRSKAEVFADIEGIIDSM